MRGARPSARSAFISFQNGQKVPERRALESGADAGERKVLAGKGRPGEIGGARQVRSRQLGDVADLQVAVAPVFGVAGRLLGIEVVGEQTSPIRAEPRARHAAAGEELVEGWAHGSGYSPAAAGASLSVFSRIAFAIEVPRDTFPTRLRLGRSIARKVSSSRRTSIRSRGRRGDSRRAECMAPCWRRAAACQRSATTTTSVAAVIFHRVAFELVRRIRPLL